MDENADESRRQLVGVLRARLRQQLQRSALASVLQKRAARLERERQELVDDYAARYDPAQSRKRERPWWKFWDRSP
ncbi:MAG: hypothetical protein ACRD1H_15015 [Vicinamibacterales bacterium]